MNFFRRVGELFRAPAADSRGQVVQSAMTSFDRSGTNGSYDDLLLWCTNIHEIKASIPTSTDSAEWNFYLNAMNTSDKEKILSFLYEADQKRAFVSILLQRAMIRRRLRMSDDTQYVILRTAEVYLS